MGWVLASRRRPGVLGWAGLGCRWPFVSLPALLPPPVHVRTCEGSPGTPYMCWPQEVPACHTLPPAAVRCFPYGSEDAGGGYEHTRRRYCSRYTRTHARSQAAGSRHFSCWPAWLPAPLGCQIATSNFDPPVGIFSRSQPRPVARYLARVRGGGRARPRPPACACWPPLLLGRPRAHQPAHQPTSCPRRI